MGNSVKIIVQKIVFVLILTGTVLPGMGQKGRFTGGALIGFNGIQIAGDIEERVGAGGLSAGLCLELSVAKKSAVQMELKYTRKGSIHPYTNPYGLHDWEVLGLHYVEIPVVARHGLGKKPNFFFVEGGLSWGYLFNTYYSETRMERYSDPPLVERFRKNEFSWIVGAGYHLNKGPLRNFSFLFRYNRSILPVHETLPYYNVVYGVYVQYLLKFTT